MKHIRKIFHKDIVELGIASELLGEEYCYIALDMLEEDPLLLCCMCKALYTGIAEKMNTNSSCVERNLRTFVAKLWGADDHKYLDMIAGRTLKKKPTNREFLDMMLLYWSER